MSVIALALVGVAIAAYYVSMLAIVFVHIFYRSGEEQLAAADATLASVLLYFTLPLALLVYLVFLQRTNYTKEPKIGDCGWRFGVLATASAGALIAGLLIDIFLLRNDGLFTLAGLPVLSRISPLTAVMFPASFFFPLAILAVYTIGGGCYSKRNS